MCSKVGGCDASVVWLIWRVNKNVVELGHGDMGCTRGNSHFQTDCAWVRPPLTRSGVTA